MTTFRLKGKPYRGAFSGKDRQLVIHRCPKGHEHEYTYGSCNLHPVTSVYCPDCREEYPPDTKSLEVVYAACRKLE